METEDDAIREDAVRAARLRSNGAPRAVELADKLDPVDLDDPPPPSPASSRFKRLFRSRLFDLAPTVIHPLSNGPFWSATIIAARWHVAADDLEGFDISRTKREFIQHLNRAGGREAGGILLGRFEACFYHDEETGEAAYQFHFHGIADERMKRVVQRLRVQPAYAKAAKVDKPIVCREVAQGELLKSLGYCFKSFWKTRGGHSQDDGSGYRSNGRLPEPYHCESLLWLDRWSIGEMSVVYGTRKLRSAFRMS